MTDEVAIELIKEVAGLKVLVEDTHGRLFGNGQKGVIEKHNDRLDDLEALKDRGIGIAWFFGIITTLLGVLESIHLIGGKKG